MSTSISLNCLVLGEGSRRIFLVKIPVNESVSILKETIKEKRKDLFNNVNASILDLWKVSFAVDERLEANILGMGFEKTELLLATNEPPQLELNCLVLGEDGSNIFTVKIPSTENVSILSAVIRNELRPTFDHVDAYTLTLWQVSIPDDSNLKLKLSELDLADERSLSPTQVLSSVFLQPPLREQVHIIVRPPPAYLPPQPPRASKSDTIGLRTKGMAIDDLEAVQRASVKAGQTVLPPSSSAVFRPFLAEQTDRPIWNGRPSTNCGIPIQLYHPSFAKFLRISRGDAVEIDLKPKAYSATHSLFHSSAVLYTNKAQRIAGTSMYLGEAIGHRLPPLDVPWGEHTMHFDGALREVGALVVLKEDKNEVGTGGCDPPHQCALGFRTYYIQKKTKSIRESCCCPSFLIALAGPWMCIFGAVFVENVVVQQLTDFIWIGGYPYDDRKLESVAIPPWFSTQFPAVLPFCSALFCWRACCQLLVPGLPLPGHSGYPKNPSKAMFVATTETGVERRNIVVKFTQRYNAEAHRHLAAERRAPELLYCSKEDHNSADFAGLIMIVMEYIDGGKTAYQQYGNRRLDQRIFDQVEEALGILHGRNIVFNDLRYPNIMITKDQRVLLIDFDWCGEHEKVTYSVSLNDARNTPNSINWHPDVKRGGKMAKEHDTFMLNRMRPQSDITSLPLATTSSPLGKRKARASGDEENEGEDV
ncbi:hypothetical protein EDB92DRAFT_1939906 [Lactarius akahatsu]|uniref:Protein kinase domain-containing protein n=1 Tax=Lactarius akahatsu TaxID=416441 RepID=A0AAD4LPC7_9AGAM|nr:hypothetical protein EDB92DRAFT_1939906 [Lactarius akahatsu]